jgi:hypothetical protein
LSAESAVVVTDIDHLGLVISHATAPAFMLGAVAAFLSILIQRMERLRTVCALCEQTIAVLILRKHYCRRSTAD